MNRRSFKVKFATAACLGLLLSATCAFAAQKGLMKRVRFARGRTTATLKNSLVRGTLDTYIVGARAGQKMTLSITSVEQNAVFRVYTPDGVRVEDTGEGQHALNWSGKLPESGDYVIEVGGTRGNATYALKVTVR